MSTKTKGRRGSALIEFTLCCAFFWVPLFFGFVIVGENLLRAQLVTQVCRDAAHMFAFGADFSQSSYQQLLVSLAPELGLSTSGGHGVVIFSQIAYIDSTCDGTNTTCTNMGDYVVTRRIVVGSTGLQSSLFGTPASTLLDSSGHVSQAGYLNNSTTRAAAPGSSFAPPINFTSPSQFAYAAELYVTSPQPSGWSTTGPPSVSARFIF
jgi:hypothetical protein